MLTRVYYSMVHDFSCIICLVRLTGLEPVRTRRQILSLLWLPITSQSQILSIKFLKNNLYYISNTICCQWICKLFHHVIGTIHPIILVRTGVGTLLGIDPADTHVPVMRTRTSSLLLHQSFEETFVAWFLLLTLTKLGGQYWESNPLLSPMLLGNFMPASGNWHIMSINLAHRRGLEPLASCVTGKRSNQLS